MESDLFELDWIFSPHVPSCNHTRLFGHIPRANFDPNRDSLLKPVKKFLCWTEVIPLIDDHFQAVQPASKSFCNRFGKCLCFRLLLIIGENWDDHHLHWCNTWWKDKTVIITVGHDQSSDHASGNSPARGPGMGLFIVSV